MELHHLHTVDINCCVSFTCVFVSLLCDPDMTKLEKEERICRRLKHNNIGKQNSLHVHTLNFVVANLHT